jgi:hypothetical protein
MKIAWRYENMPKVEVGYCHRTGGRVLWTECASVNISRQLATTGMAESHDHTVGNIGAFCLRMRENRSVRLQMADLPGL